jgi:hypothetical protein
MGQMVAGESSVQTGGQFSTIAPVLAPLLIVLAIFAAYSNSFRGPFVYDDLDAIRNNPEIRTLIPWETSGRTPSTIAGRPVLRFSFALDYLVGGLDVWIYHVNNLLIHIGAALLLYGIVRRNFGSTYWDRRFTGCEQWLAAAIAIIWGIHPLNTEAVTYIVQRAESLAGLFYLAVIYSLIRSATASPRSGLWTLAAVVACVLGVATKEFVATAPLVALIYDRTFLAGSFRDAFSKRRQLYAGLAVSWIIVALLIAGGARAQSISGHAVTVGKYLLTQAGVIAHYLRLAVWPTGLVLDEAWPMARRVGDVPLGGWLVPVLLISSIIALWKKPWLGFLGAWYFLILAPSSSIIPIITETSAEHRMYLPLIAPVALAMTGGWSIARQLSLQTIAIALFSIAVIGLGWMTFDRNRDYRIAEIIWRDAILKNPGNARAHYNLGFALEERGRLSALGSPRAMEDATAAAAEFRTTLKLMSDYYPAALRLGEEMVDLNELRAAEDYYSQVLSAPAPPEFIAAVHFQRATLRARRADWSGAAEDYRAELALRPDDSQSHYLLGIVLAEQKDWEGATKEFEAALHLDPRNMDIQARLAQARLQLQMR